MSQPHSWLVPTYDGLTYLDKPAFYFKTIALSFSLFGESEGVARLSSAFFGFLLLEVMFLFCQRVYDQRSCHAHRSHDATLHRVFATCHF
jgi:4-amino-4-deoxy-L-arabinose transferase-like glycosyltransferase